MEQTEILKLMALPLTGAGNAERLQALLAKDWRYVPQIRYWVRWNGRFWQEEEEKFLIAFGPGGCGKGTFFETVAAVMGGFKAVIPVDTLLAGTFYTNGEGPTPELDERTEPSLGYLQHTKAMDDFNKWLLIGGNVKWNRKRFSEAMKSHGKMKVRRGCGYCYPDLCLKM